MAKLIRINNSSLSGKLAAIGPLFFGSLSAAESDVLVELITRSDGSGLNVSAETGAAIRTALNLNDNTFNTVLFRLNKKKAIIKDKTRITLSPILNSLFKENEFLIRFENPEIKV